MAGRDVLAGFVVLMAVGGGCGAKGADNRVPHSCSGAAVNITVVPAPAVASDAGADAGNPSDGGGDDAKPPCTGPCLEYIEALRVAVEAATPARCMRMTFGTGLSCLPSSTSPGCATNTVAEANALEAQIRDYLAASWPEVDTPLSVETCVCRIYSEA